MAVLARHNFLSVSMNDLIKQVPVMTFLLGKVLGSVFAYQNFLVLQLPRFFPNGRPKLAPWVIGDSISGLEFSAPLEYYKDGPQLVCAIEATT